MVGLHVHYLDLEVHDGFDGSPTVVRVAGELDAAARPSAQAVVEAIVARKDPVVLDLSEVTFFSAAGISMVLALQQRAADVGTDLVVRDPHPAVLRLLVLSGVMPHVRMDRRDRRVP